MLRYFMNTMQAEKNVKSRISTRRWKKSYAKYFYQPISDPNPELMEILKQRPIDALKDLMPENITHLLYDGYNEVETGYCVLSNWPGYVSVNNKFSGATFDDGLVVFLALSWKYALYDMV